ncbi:nitrite/sulfite reductase [Hydrogenimonas sp.]
MLPAQHLTLKKFEQFKAAMRPYDYFEMLDTLDFESLGEGDRFYLQCFGIYNSELEEESFMLRIRTPGGRIRAEHFSEIAKIAKSHDLRMVLTARAGIQLHDLEPENILEVFKAVNAMEGLTTWQTFGDNIRNVVTDPFDGRGVGCEIEVFPLIEKMQSFFVRNPDLVGMLPRRVSVGITGMRHNVSPLFSNDLLFALAKKGDLTGFNVYIGGKNTEVAMSADIFLVYDEVVPFFEALIFAFNRYGSREKRTRSRLFHMIEDIGMEGLKEKISEFYRKPWRGAGELQLQKWDFADFETLSDGSFGYRYRTDYGVVTPEEFEAIAGFVLENGAEVRLGIDQQIYILGINDKEVPFGRRETAPTVLACAGSEYCPFSYWSIKEESHMLPQREIEECGVIVGFSGCLKGCGRHKHADIGIVGLRSSRFGDDDRSARIFLGAEYTSGKRAAEAVFQSVPLAQMGRVVSLVLDEFRQSGFDTFEAFSASVLNRYEPEFLHLWFMAKLESGLEAKLLPDRDEMELMERNFAEKPYTALAKEKGFGEAAASIVKALWYAQEAPKVHHVRPEARRSR